MRKIAMAAAAGAMSVVAPLSFAAEAAAGSGAPERTGGVSARDSGHGVAPVARVGLQSNSFPPSVDSSLAIPFDRAGCVTRRISLQR